LEIAEASKSLYSVRTGAKRRPRDDERVLWQDFNIKGASDGKRTLTPGLNEKYAAAVQRRTGRPFLC
jgi:hypothetical protein